MIQAAIVLLVVTLLGASARALAASDLATDGFTAPDKDQRLAGIRGHEEVLLHNTDAIVGARLWLGSGPASSTFVYADVGATNSALRWQGLAGIHSGHGIDLVGGWRRVTYHYTPGAGFDSLDFDGPFIGATLAL